MEFLLGMTLGIVLGGAIVFAVLYGTLSEQKSQVLDRLETVKTHILAWSENAVVFGNYRLAAELRDLAQKVADEAKKVSEKL